VGLPGICSEVLVLSFTEGWNKPEIIAWDRCLQERATAAYEGALRMFQRVEQAFEGLMEKAGEGLVTGVDRANLAIETVNEGVKVRTRCNGRAGLLSMSLA
jgi:hypothetical protein